MKKLLFLFVALLGAGTMYFAYAQSTGTYVCTYCGLSNPSADSMRTGYCNCNPSGSGSHIPFFLSPREQYTCRFCGYTTPSRDMALCGMCSYSCSGNHIPVQ